MPELGLGPRVRRCPAHRNVAVCLAQGGGGVAVRAQRATRGADAPANPPVGGQRRSDAPANLPLSARCEQELRLGGHFPSRVSSTRPKFRSASTYLWASTTCSSGKVL